MFYQSDIRTFALKERETKCEMKDEGHFIVKSSDRLDEKGLVVIDDFTRFPLYGEPFLSPFFLIVLNHRGWLKLEYDFTPYEFREHDFTLIYPNHVLTFQESSEDFLATLIVFTRDFLELLRQMFPNHFKFSYHFHNIFHLREEQYNGLNICFKQLKLISTLDHPEQKELLAAQVDISAQLTEFYLKENNIIIDDKSATQQLLMRFHVAIAENYCKSREVRFYADKLCLSPKYFGTLVRRATGISAGEWIALYVMVQAKLLLSHHRDLTIQQISDRLGFSDQTSFAHYFKSRSGQTPLEYRERKL